MNLDPQFDKRTSVLDVDRKADKIWAQAYGRAIARGETDDEARASADLEAQTFESEWWGD